MSERKEGKFSNGWSSNKGNSAIIFPSVLFRGTLSQPAEWVKVNSRTVKVLKIDYDSKCHSNFFVKYISNFRRMIKSFRISIFSAVTSSSLE